ncbi:hypothetical protein QP534_09380 [Cutibacterium avidum]|nr:hypothetical protein [Cutibacterium avidum]
MDGAEISRPASRGNHSLRDEGGFANDDRVSMPHVYRLHLHSRIVSPPGIRNDSREHAYCAAGFHGAVSLPASSAEAMYPHDTAAVPHVQFKFVHTTIYRRDIRESVSQIKICGRRRENHREGCG